MSSQNIYAADRNKRTHFTLGIFIMNKETREERILSTAQEHFSMCGYYGARMDTIASESKINKRIVYEFCHTKEDLYMMVLSHVSRNTAKMIDEWFENISSNTPHALYAGIIDTLENNPIFIRLWAWERLATTIHGPRILETCSSIFEKLRRRIRTTNPNISDEQFEAVEALCHGYLLTSAMYMRCDPETDIPETDTNSSLACRRLDTAMKCQAVLLECIQKLLDD